MSMFEQQWQFFSGIGMVADFFAGGYSWYMEKSTIDFLPKRCAKDV